MIELSGDIGSGKTTFTQGFLDGLGYRGEAPSPTFTVGRVYPVRDGWRVHHFDFYRLEGYDVVTEALAEALADPKAIVIVEWASNGKAELPPDRLQIVFHLQEEPDGRKILVKSSGVSTRYLIKELHRVDHATD